MHLSTLRKITHNFTQELILAGKGTKTSFPFISHTLPKSSLVRDGDTFQVLVIGGSIVKSALVKKTKKSLEIISHSSASLPVLSHKDVFLEVIEAYLHRDITFLAINFAQPIEPLFENNKLDGKLLFGTKEHAFTSLLGEAIGKTVEEHIAKKHGRKLMVSVANDTICLLLSGLTKKRKNIACGIVGTGLNFSFFTNATTAINLEAGEFNKFKMSDSGKHVDRNSLQPKWHVFEKEISGGYLYQHFNYHVAKHALPYRQITSSTLLSELAKQKTKEGLLARKILQKSAQLIACALAAITTFQKTDTVFVMQGSLFWEGHNYKKTVEKFFKKLLPERTIVFLAIDHADILGGAKLIA